MISCIIFHSNCQTCCATVICQIWGGKIQREKEKGVEKLRKRTSVVGIINVHTTGVIIRGDENWKRFNYQNFCKFRI